MQQSGLREPKIHMKGMYEAVSGGWDSINVRKRLKRGRKRAIRRWLNQLALA